MINSPMQTARAELKMVVLASRDARAETARAVGLLGVSAGVHDPFIGALGLADEVFAVGDTYVQILEPLDEKSRAHRWITRKGGDAGYLLVVQTDDADGVIQRCAEAGVRVTFDGVFEGNRVVQLHAGDLRILFEIDEMQHWDTWHWDRPETDPAVPEAVSDLVAVDCIVDEPVRLAGLLGTLLAIPHDGGSTLTIGGRRVRFLEGAKTEEGIVAVEFRTSDPSRIGETFPLCGTTIRLVG